MIFIIFSLLGLHLLLQLGIHSSVWWLVATLLGTTMSKCAIIVPISYILLSFL